MKCANCNKPIMFVKSHWIKQMPFCYKCFKARQRVEKEFDKQLKGMGVKVENAA